MKNKLLISIILFSKLSFCQTYSFMSSVYSYKTTGITIDKLDNVYVSFFGLNGGITRLSINDKKYKKLAIGGTNYPNSIAISKKFIIGIANELASSTSCNVTISDTIQRIGCASSTSNSWLSTPLSVAFDENELLYIGHYYGIHVYDYNTKRLVTTGVSEYTAPQKKPTIVQGIAIDTISHNMYYTYGDTIYVEKLGSYSFDLKRKIVPNNYKSFGLCFNEKRNLLITDYINSQVIVIDTLGNVLQRIGSLGSGNENFNQPRFIAVDSKFNMYVTDYSNDRVQIYSPSKLITSNDDETIKKSDVGLFPNPTSDFLNLTIKEPYRYEVFDVFGNSQSGQMKIESKTDKRIDVSNLKNGVYSLKIEQNNKINFMQFVKN